MAPWSVSVPASLLTREAAASVIVPAQVLLLARLRMAPAAAIPVPLRLVMGSPMDRPLPSIWIAAPDATVVAPDVAPRAVLVWRSRTPADRVVRPE